MLSLRYIFLAPKKLIRLSATEINIHLFNNVKRSFKRFLLLLTAVVSIFVSYFYVSHQDLEFRDIRKNEYSFRKYDVDESNRKSQFDDKAKGNFIIHPGEEKASKGTFTFNKKLEIKLHFFIPEGEDGEIRFIVSHNKNELLNKIVTPASSSTINFQVAKYEIVEISANRYGNTNNDYGVLKLTAIPSKNFIAQYSAPLIFALLVVALMSKNQVYIAVNSYIIFIIIFLADKLNFKQLRPQDIFTYLNFALSAAFLFSLVYQELKRLKRFRIASILCYVPTILLCAIPLLSIIYVLNFGVRVNKDVLYAVFQTNPSEAYEYVLDFVSYEYVALFIFVILAIGYLFYLQERKKIKSIERVFLIFMFLMTSVFTVTTAQYSDIKLPTFIATNFGKYYRELSLFKEVQKERKAGEINFSASKSKNGEVYVIILGESLNKKHMSLYGYFRDTTPLLEELKQKDELTVFSNVYSNHTHTVPVFQLGLTSASQYNAKDYYESPSIIEILNKAKFETYWLTNQLIYGAWDNMISVIAVEANNVVTLNSSIGKVTTMQQYDGALINEVKKALAESTDKNKVIFVHLMGNHTPYHKRHPAEYTKFSGDLNQGQFGSQITEDAKINEYDNSVLYNDYVVSSILSEVRKEEEGVSAFLYIADHGEDVLADLGHNSGKYTYEMSQIPMVMWFSEQYKKRYKQEYTNLVRREKILFSNDLIYDTMIGFMGVSTDVYDPSQDLSSDAYELKPSEALVLHGDIKYTNADNYIYWQKLNAQYLVDTNQSHRIFPHRVNSVGKLRDVWNDGFRSIEIDVRFGDDNMDYFRVGHHSEVMGLKLEDFFSAMEATKVDRIWLDFKNLTVANYREALKRLDYLDSRFDLKSKSILEISAVDSFVREFSAVGWHTSYYLPTSKVLNLLNSNDEVGVKRLADRVAEQISAQNTYAVSFDHRLYNFVKRYLESEIGNGISYHAWYGPAISDAEFQERLKNNELYLDERVKTILSKYESQFHL